MWFFLVTSVFPHFNPHSLIVKILPFIPLLISQRIVFFFILPVSFYKRIDSNNISPAPCQREIANTFIIQNLVKVCPQCCRLSCLDFSFFITNYQTILICFTVGIFKCYQFQRSTERRKRVCVCCVRVCVSDDECRSKGWSGVRMKERRRSVERWRASLW